MIHASWCTDSSRPNTNLNPDPTQTQTLGLVCVGTAQMAEYNVVWALVRTFQVRASRDLLDVVCSEFVDNMHAQPINHCCRQNMII